MTPHRATLLGIAPTLLIIGVLMLVSVVPRRWMLWPLA